MDLTLVIYGVGYIGSLIAKYAIKRGFKVEGAIDIDPIKVGRDLGEVIGLNERLGVVVRSDAESVLKEVKPDVVIHTTTSWLDRALPQIVLSLRYGANVVSTCETLSYPYHRYPYIADLLDTYAKSRNLRVISVGINPGFLLDVLPAFLTLPHIEVRRILARRVVDASKRRKSFQAKIGLGLRPEEFMRKLRQGKLTGHVGYAESVYLLASMLGIRLTKVSEGQEPVIASEGEVLRTPYYEIRAGSVKGIKGYGIGYVNEKEFIRIEFHAIAGIKDEFEEIVIDGDPKVRWVSSGTPGDIATTAVVLNVIPKLLRLNAGLKTMADLVRISYSLIS